MTGSTPAMIAGETRQPGPLLKICGLTQHDQAASIAALGVDAIGVIGVASSPRHVVPGLRAGLFEAVRQASPRCERVLVVADPQDEELNVLDPRFGHTLVQLHGGESPERCRKLRQRSGCPVWKALRLRRPEDLAQVEAYAGSVDALLLDAWMPDQLGGTGRSIPLDWLLSLRTTLPWWLAGGIDARRVPEVLNRLAPTGLDVSSSVEHAPGDKDLSQVRQLVATVRGWRPHPGGDSGQDQGWFP